MGVHLGKKYHPHNVLLVKIEGPVWYTIYHHLPVVKGVIHPSINQPTNGKRICPKLLGVLPVLPL